jgi:alcohol dehydrogenase, propanol-preferring
MRAMLLERPGPAGPDEPLRLVTLPDPVPGHGQLVIRVHACGVCRTDLQLASGDLEQSRLPVVPGHQAVGVVERTGDGVQEFAPGDRAGVAWLGYACGTCRYCTADDENLCCAARFTGWDVDGGYAERVLVDARFALRIPDGFSDTAAAPLLCGGVIGYRALRLSGIEAGGRIGLYGFGASALIAIQVARHWHCEVYVATRSPAERERALGLGAAWVGSYDETPPVALDAAVTFAPAGSVVVSALRAVRRGGTVVINAIHLDQVPSFPYELLWWERSLRSVANFTRADARALLQLATQIPIRTQAEIHPLAAANTALWRLAQGKVRGAAVLEMPAGSAQTRAAAPTQEA